ncbi:hypothetical protein [Allokutzneria sp. NRRL B-24872]|uniref:hypothetical protein n=1 Tax=Allokutzneria sp. NRRL B-24872 TaxID=1137961 RepID=UPI000A36813E|nr:hypothetical protein [Allokutzneria sp. NRRL B-24872]
MYQATEARRDLHEKWVATFAELARTWSEDVSWDDARASLSERMSGIGEGPGPAQRAKLFDWLDTSMPEDYRRQLIDDNGREALFRSLLAQHDADLHDVFMHLYQPQDGDRHWNEQQSMVFQAGAWQEYGTDTAADTTAEADAELKAQGWTADSDKAARLDIPYWNGEKYLVYRDGAWQDLDAELEAELTAEETEELTAQLGAALAEVIAENPELAELSPEELREAVRLGLEEATRA